MAPARGTNQSAATRGAANSNIPSWLELLISRYRACLGLIAANHQQQGQQKQQQGAKLGQRRRQRLAVVGLAYLQLDIVGDGQQAAPELGEIPMALTGKVTP